MILERASFQIREGQEAAFEAAFDEARLIVARAPGLRSVRLARGVEEPLRYLVLLKWDSVADHERFRESELFGGWAELLRPHYAAMPEAEHYELVEFREGAAAKPTDADILAAHQLSAAWGHILDARVWDRLGECLTEDAIYDGSVFGIEPAVGLDAIRRALSGGQHASAHHATNVVVLEGPGDELRMLSKGLGVLEGGGVASVTYIDRLVPGPSGWRIAERVIQTQA